ncbi:MAG: hypothetical protein RIS35_111 [Pseudomonadota bacterium]
MPPPSRGRRAVPAPGAADVSGHEASILACVRKNRERFDFEIAAELDLPLDAVRQAGSGLIASGDVMSCRVTRYENGAPVEAELYRISGYLPTPGPGRRPKAPT